MVGVGRYTTENLAAGLHDPRILLGELYRFGAAFNSTYYRQRCSSGGTHVVKEDWDNLLILDACRYDMFEEQNFIAGDLERRRSLGSESWEFLDENFVGGEFHDTVYITANPHTTKLPDGTFHAVINLLDDGWDPEQRTVLPETVVTATRRAAERFPEKRLIVHFMQPHFPFIGDSGRRLDHGGIEGSATENGDSKRHVWGALRHGRISKTDVRKAYCENLDVVLPHVDALLDSLSGKSIITSDHGNLLGERIGPLPVRGYGHPRGLDTPALRTVPWLVVDGSDRRSVVAEPPVGDRNPDDRTVEQRLEALGYQ